MDFSFDPDEAIELLEGGIEGIRRWNELSSTQRQICHLGGANLCDVSLCGANLRDQDLSGADLSRADLSKANLDGAKLDGAELAQAKLREASLYATSLSEANLREADLFDAFLRTTDLSLTDLRGADLTAANLNRANLRGAQFHGAKFAGTTFVFVNLSTAEGLGEAVHKSPSDVSLATIQKSGGKIPDVFLRGCGVPEEWITYLPSLIGMLSPIDFYSCFISYSSNNQEFCKRLHGRLTQDKLRVSFAPEDMKRGQKIHEQIESAIRVHDKLLLVLSEKSMASEWVNHEIYTARQREEREGRKVLFPVALCPFDEIKAWKCFDADTGRDMAREIREYYIPNFSSWKDHDSFEAEYDKLLRDLKKTAEDEQAAGVSDTR